MNINPVDSYLIVGEEATWGEACNLADMEEIIYEFVSTSLKYDSANIKPTRFRGHASPIVPVQNYLDANGDIQFHLHVGDMAIWFKHFLNSAGVTIADKVVSEEVYGDGTGSYKAFAVSPMSLDTQPAATTPSTSPGRLIVTLSEADTGTLIITGKDAYDGTLVEELQFSSEITKTTNNYFKSVDATGIAWTGFTKTVKIFATKTISSTAEVSEHLHLGETLLDGLTIEVVKGGRPYTYLGMMINSGTISIGDVLMLNANFMGKVGFAGQIPATGHALAVSETPASTSGYVRVNQQVFPTWAIEVTINEIPYCVNGMSINVGNNLVYPTRFCGSRYRSKPRRSSPRDIYLDCGVDLISPNVFDAMFTDMTPVPVQFLCTSTAVAGYEYTIQVDMPNCYIDASPDPPVSDFSELIQPLRFYPTRTEEAVTPDELEVTLECTEL